MKFHHFSLNDCSEAAGLVILIDVLRAFSNSAYVFAAGAEKIHLVSSVEEALALKMSDPGILAAGEVGGLPPAGFDLGNSPTQTISLDLWGRTLVQRTGAGTQAAVRSIHADILLASSFVVAGATARHIQSLHPQRVNFVITGGVTNDEDLALAEYLEALLKGQKPDPGPYLKRVYDSRDAEGHLDPAKPEFPESDLDLCTRIDRFSFSMPVRRENGHLVMRRFHI